MPETNLATPIEIAFSISDSSLDHMSLEKCKDVQCVFKALQECRKTARANDVDKFMSEIRKSESMYSRRSTSFGVESFINSISYGRGSSNSPATSLGNSDVFDNSASNQISSDAMGALMDVLNDGLNLESSYTDDESSDKKNGRSNNNSNNDGDDRIRSVGCDHYRYVPVGEDTNAYLVSKFHKSNRIWQLCCEAQASSVYR